MTNDPKGQELLQNGEPVPEEVLRDYVPSDVAPMHSGGAAVAQAGHEILLTFLQARSLKHRTTQAQHPNVMVNVPVATISMSEKSLKELSDLLVKTLAMMEAGQGKK